LAKRLQVEVNRLRDALQEISDTESCKHDFAFNLMLRKGMMFDHDRKHYDKYCGECNCPKCIADRVILESPKFAESKKGGRK